MEPKQLTDRLEANTALMLELDEKVEKRVMEIMQKHIYMYAPSLGSALACDASFIANMGRKLGEREARNWGT
jgi:hypothetical protein